MEKKVSLKKAAGIYGAAKYATILVQLVISAVLSRILTPNDYGIVAVVTVFTTLFSTLANLGLGTAVTQFKDLSKEDVQDIFTFSQYFSVALAGIFALAAYPIAAFYNDMVYVPIVLLLTISVLFNALNMIPNALLLKEKEFLKVGIRMIAAAVLSGVAAIFLAFCGAKYYALVAESILSAFITFAWNFYGSGLKLKVRFSYRPIQYVKSYSLNQFLYNLANYFAQNLDNMLTGKIMGNEMLAYYNKGYTLMRYPVTNIAHVITPVLHPILSDHQNDKKYIYDEFIKISKFLSLLGVFIAAFCFWADTEIIVCYFGDQWYAAVSPFRWLSICICVQLLNALFGSIYQSLGCTRQMLQSGMFHISISLLAIFMGAYTKNITWMAVFVSASMFVKFFIECYFLIRKSFGYSVSAFLKSFLPDCLIFAVMFIAFGLIGDFKQYGLWASLFIKLGIACAVFLALLVVTKQLHYLYIIIPARFRKNNG